MLFVSVTAAIQTGVGRDFSVVSNLYFLMVKLKIFSGSWSHSGLWEGDSEQHKGLTEKSLFLPRKSLFLPGKSLFLPGKSLFLPGKSLFLPDSFREKYENFRVIFK